MDNGGCSSAALAQGDEYVDGHRGGETWLSWLPRLFASVG